LYSNCNFSGTSIELGQGDYSRIADLGISNDALSSLSIPAGYEVTLYQHGNFGGNSITLTSDNSCLNGDNFNDSASSLRIRSNQCCSDPTTVTLNILEGPTASLQVSDPEICAGQKTTITAIASGGDPGYTYQWDNNLGTDNSVEVMPNNNTAYRVTVTDDKGCTTVGEASINPESCRYDLALIKTLADNQPSTVTVGDQVVYNIIIANQGEVPSNAYEVEDRMPLGMSYVTSSDGGVFDNNRTVNWTLPNINPGQQKILTLTLQVEDATLADFRNWAEISDDSSEDFNTTDEDSTPDSFTGNDSVAGLGGITTNDDAVNHNNIDLDEPPGDEDDNDFEDVAVEVKYDLALIKTLAGGQTNSVGLGDLVNYTVTIANQGNVPSESYDVTDQIPAGMSFVSASDNAVESGGVVTWTGLSSLDPGQTKNLSIILRVDDATQGDYRNWAEISRDGAATYGTTDEDSTPDTNVGNDNAAGFGNDPNDPFDNHNDISLDEPPGDEDDNDFEDVSVNVSYDLALIKTLGSGQSSTAVLGDRIVYSIVIANQGNVPSNSYSVTDQIPAGMSFVSASDFGTANGSTVTWTNLSNLDPGSTKELSLILIVEDATLGDYRNWAEISDDSASDFGVTDEDSTPDSNVGNDNAAGFGSDPNDPFNNHNDITLDEPAGDEDDNDFEDIAVEVSYDLALVKTLAVGQSATVTVGDVVNYTITVANQGNVPSNTYSVTDQIPAGMSFVSASNGGTANNGVVTWSNLSNLAPSATGVLNLTLRVEDATLGDYRNWAEISDDSAADYGVTDEDSTPDTNTGNDNSDGFGNDPNDPFNNHNDITLDEPAGDEDDNDFEDVAVEVSYDLALVKTLGDGQSASVSLGDIVAYNITIANQGNVPSGPYEVVDQIPRGMSFVSASNGGTESNGVVTWTGLANLAPGATTNISILLRVEDAIQSDYRNWAEISDDNSAAFNTTDEDSTPDAVTGNDNASGTGIAPNDPVDNHNDITLDNPPGDEDDNDFEDVQLEVNYDLALIKTLLLMATL